MKTVLFVIKILIALFLFTAVTVHVVGPFYPKFPEPLWSHIIHIVSYSLCLFAFLRSVKFRLPLYCIGAIYPLAYHANCFFTQLFELHKFNSICFEVIIVLPLGALLIFVQPKNS